MRRIGPYRLVKKIAQGGMGTVFLAERTTPEGRVESFAVKCMLESLAGDAEMQAMFIDEARLVSRLRHPNVARLHEFGVIDGQHFIAMEHIAGQDLKRIIHRLRARRQPLPIPVALRIVIDLCAGLHYAHTLADGDVALAIIHRDVSPTNVMVSYDGTVKLLDFGIAKNAFRTTATRPGNLKGKLAFLSPEQITGAEVDARADVFCSGLVLHMLLVGRHPFWRGTGVATTHAIVHEPPPDPRRWRPDLPDELVDILARSLARDREQRFASAAELGRALEQALERLAPGFGSDDVASFMAGLFGDKGTRPAVPTAAAQVTPTEPLPHRPSSRSQPALVTPRVPWMLAVAGFGFALAVGLVAAHSPRRVERRPVSRPPPVEVAVAAAPLPAATPMSVPAPVALGPVVSYAESPGSAALAPPPSLWPARSSSPPAGRPPVRGRLDRRRQLKVLQTAQPRFAACPRRHAAALPPVSRVTIGVVVGGNGRVVSVRTRTPGGSPPALRSCLEGEAGRLRFPRQPGHNIDLAIPVAYRKPD